ncbi:uncharacterized protein LOC132552595 [Ylistrum balloti]|uniref:uncharacterized protein LOC132552595 n=1 Tax=Ylistrum balloti TaxID=509963 RepID=UPI002905D8DC|nr:uncharacterized protein LOC132552595 [Ylistrum balloti]
MMVTSVEIVVVIILAVRLTSSARGDRIRQPRSDVTLISVLNLERKCGIGLRKLSQYESYQVTWDGGEIEGNCQKKFLAENPYNVATQYKVCFRFLAYDIQDCRVKVRFSETSWMYFNYVHDTMEYGCKDSMPLDQWCGGWIGQAWFSLHSYQNLPVRGNFIIEVTAKAETNLEVTECIGIVVGGVAGILLLFFTWVCIGAKCQIARNNMRRARLRDVMNMRSMRQNRILLDSSASFTGEEHFTASHSLQPSAPPVPTDITPSQYSPLQPQSYRGQSPSSFRIGRSSPIDADNSTDDVLPSTNMTGDLPPPYHSVVSSEPDQTENLLPTEQRDIAPPSYDDCMQYAIT